jgi:hypothetical protein
MRFRIFLITYVLLILYAILFFAYLWPNGEAIVRFASAVVMGILVLRVLLSDRKYISHFSLTKSALQVQYMTQFFTSKSVSIPLEEIIDIRLTNTKWIRDYAGTIQVKLQGDTVEYHILKKSQLQEIEQLLGSRDWGRPLTAHS